MDADRGDEQQSDTVQSNKTQEDFQYVVSIPAMMNVCVEPATYLRCSVGIYDRILMGYAR